MNLAMFLNIFGLVKLLVSSKLLLCPCRIAMRSINKVLHLRISPTVITKQLTVLESQVATYFFQLFIFLLDKGVNLVQSYVAHDILGGILYIKNEKESTHFANP